MTKSRPYLATFCVAALLAPGLARAQSKASPEMFNEQDVVHGISISRATCRRLVPFVFLARPGAYGSAGYHPTTASTQLEADLVAAQITAISTRYGVRSWVLGGHSGGGTLVAAMLARRTDIRCAVISSGAPAYNAYLEAHDVAWRVRSANLNAIDDVGKIAPKSLRVIVMGDPRDENVFWPVQALYYHALKSHGVDATLMPLERGRPDEFHSLVDHGEAATGLCAEGTSMAEIRGRLEAMPSQGPRISN
jgi:pimeloyl-ACP methyl ester carboxylesterase